MQKLTYVTTNAVKFRTAALLCQKSGISLVQRTLEVPEIQAADGKLVARDKALRVFEELQEPVVISDDSWIIPGLKGFPGPFMRYMSDWLTVTDLLRLTAPLKDRRITLRQVVVYQDAKQQHVFYTDVEGLLLDTPQGDGTHALMSIISFDGGKTSAAEAIASSGSALVHAQRRTSWHDLCEWLNNQDA